jgi:hypothetical protein
MRRPHISQGFRLFFYLKSSKYAKIEQCQQYLHQTTFQPLSTVSALSILAVALIAYILVNQKSRFQNLPSVPSGEITSSADKIQECLKGDFIQGQMGGGDNNTYKDFFLNTQKGKDFLLNTGLVYCGSYIQPHPRGGDVMYYVYKITNKDLAKEVKLVTANDNGSEDMQHSIRGGDLDVWFEQKYTGKNLEQYGGW